MKLGLITGTGLESFGAGQCQNQALETPYGRVTVEYMRAGDQEVYLLPRHGREHDIPPHMINYRANIMALKLLG
ncbi:MAG: S-methyl-5'-thioadenosine phosphorylase, partial [Armatimonadia bacterium]